MEKLVPTAADHGWLRSYAALSRSGLVTRQLAACERQWDSRFYGNPAAIEAAQKAPGYDAYVQALRRDMRLPVRVYRVCRESSYRRWRLRSLSTPLATTLSLPIAEAVWQLKKRPGFLLLQVLLRDPRSVLMRGRLACCELVIDLSRIEARDVVPLKGPAASAMATRNSLSDQRLSLP
jgi:hypothetical protein